jgi:hypothetical protein
MKGSTMDSDQHMSKKSDNIPDDFLEVHSAGIDQGQLMTRVDDRVKQRRAEIGMDKTRFPSFDGVPYPGTPDGVEYDPDLYHHLRLANKYYIEIETEPVLEASPATRIPLAGRLWSSVRLHAHHLVLFYVNRAARHEVEVNRHMVSVLNALAMANTEQGETIRKLENQLESIRTQLNH